MIDLTHLIFDLTLQMIDLTHLIFDLTLHMNRSFQSTAAPLYRPVSRVCKHMLPRSTALHPPERSAIPEDEFSLPFFASFSFSSEAGLCHLEVQVFDVTMAQQKTSEHAMKG